MQKPSRLQPRGSTLDGAAATVQRGWEQLLLLLRPVGNLQFAEEATVIETAGVVRQLIIGARDDMHKWQQTCGLWDEKTKRAVNRGLLNVSLFSGKPNNLTIYEYEEFITYKKAAALSVSEDLAEPKAATKKAIADMKDEASILAYLKTNYGNPLFLLEAGQKEMGAWGPCKSSNSQGGHLNTSTILFAMKLLSTGNKPMIIISMRHISMRHTSTRLC